MKPIVNARPFGIGLAALAVFSLAAPAPAATLIEERDSESVSQMWVEGGRMRAQARGEPGYMLMDLRKRTMLMVNTQRKQVVDMSATVFGRRGASAAGAGSGATGTLRRVGDGPTIAGYATEHYVVEVDGETCEELYVSRQAFRDSGWAELWAETGKAFKEMAAEDEGEDADPCDIADVQAADPAKIGWPLKTVSSDGEVTEVLRIEADVKLPDGGFEVPPGYRVMSMQEMMSSGFEDDEEDEGED